MSDPSRGSIGPATSLKDRLLPHLLPQCIVPASAGPASADRQVLKQPFAVGNIPHEVRLQRGVLTVRVQHRNVTGCLEHHRENLLVLDDVRLTQLRVDVIARDVRSRQVLPGIIVPPAISSSGSLSIHRLIQFALRRIQATDH